MALKSSRQLMQEYEEYQWEMWDYQCDEIVDRFMESTGLKDVAPDEYPLLWFIIRELEMDWDKAMLIITDKEWY